MVTETDRVALQTRVSGPAWRSEFLTRIEAIPDFLTLVDRSRERNFSARSEMAPAMADHAQRVIRQYSLHELRVARQFYNAQHLLAFWRRYNEIISTGIARGILSRRFPLLSVKVDAANRSLTLDSLKLEQATAGIFRRLDASLPPRFEWTDCDAGDRALAERLSEQDVLDSLHGRLAWILQQARTAGSILYTQFLGHEREAGSDQWAWYKIHVFLDNFLYNADGGSRGLSRFEFVFFSSNKEELMVWLAWELRQGSRLGIPRVRSFLARQTKFNMALSQRISLAENEVRNSRRDLLAYDPSSEIVKLAIPPGDILENAERHFREMDVRSLGCPFGREKGVARNALAEIYEYFNQLFVRAIEGSWEFQRLFGTHRNPRRIT